MPTPEAREARVRARRVVTFAGLLILVFVSQYLFAHGLSQQVNRESERRSQEKLVELHRSCDRGNVVRGLQLRDDLDVRHDGGATFRRDVLLSPLLNCYETVFERAGAGVPMIDANMRQYLAILRTGRAPVVTRDAQSGILTIR